MNVSQVSLLLGLLALLALGIGVVVIALVVTGRAERLRPLHDLLVPLAAAIAIVATLGSLYYSGIAHFTPCRLCWWQRIFMYPLAPILAIAAWRRDRQIAFYGLPLALVGLGHSVYHTQLQWFPEQGSSCSAEAPCSAKWVDTFGFLSIPFMAMCGFVAIAALLVASLRLNRSNDTAGQDLANELASSTERQPA